MTQREVNWVMVDLIKYDYLWPSRDDEDAIYGFTHSLEVNEICAGMLPPHVVTPVEKTELESALTGYVARRGIGALDEATIRAWLQQMSDQVAIIERETYPSG